MSRLLLLTEYYSPVAGRTSGLMEDLVESLAAHGHTVTVVCSTQQYRGSHASTEDQVPAGAKVVRCRVTRLSRSSNIGRFLNWSVFLGSAWRHLQRYSKQVDAVLAVINPIPLHWLAPTRRGKHNPKFVALVWDLLPDSAVALGVLKQHSPLASLARQLNRRAFARVDAIVVPGSDMREYVQKTYAIAGEKLSVISNWSDTARLYLDKGLSLPRALNLERPFCMLAAGTMGMAQDIDQMRRIASMVEEEEGLTLTIVGGGRLIGILHEWVQEQHLQHTRVLGFCDGATFGHLLSTASCGLVSLDQHMLGLGVPSRTYTYLCAGLPVLALIPDSSETAVQLTTTGAGYLARDVETMMAYVRKLQRDTQMYNRMSAAALAAARGPLSRCRAVGSYERVLFD